MKVNSALITQLTQDNPEVFLFTSTSRTQNQDPIKIPFYNTFTTNKADERHAGSGIAIPYTTVRVYTTTESPHHHHSPHISTTTEFPHHHLRVPTPPPQSPHTTTFLFLIYAPDIHGITFHTGNIPTRAHSHFHPSILTRTLYHHTAYNNASPALLEA